MRRLMLAIIAAVSTVALVQIASAADLPRKAPALAAPPPPPAISWTGWYAGFNVGGIWGGDDINVSTSNSQFCLGGCGGGLETALASAQGATGVFSGDKGGFIGGGQFGYNWQFANSWVAGFEADIQGVGNGHNQVVGGTFGLPSFTCCSVTTSMALNKEIDYLGTVRGRLGWLAFPNLLVYGTGGFAYGGVKANTNISQTLNGPFGGVALSLGSNSGISETRTGWTAGAGFEWMLGPRWSAKAEYLYYDLGHVTYNGLLVDAFTGAAPAGVPAFFTNNVQTTTRFNGNIARLGLNYHF
jgi:outer membrane immunogenic protein